MSTAPKINLKIRPWRLILLILAKSYKLFKKVCYIDEKMGEAQFFIIALRYLRPFP